MSKLKLFIISVAGLGVISAGAFGIAAAATNGSSNKLDIGGSGISISTFRQDKLQAAATVLNTTTANIQTALKNHTLKQLIQNASLTRKSFLEKVRAELTTELEKQGYSQDQVIIALQNRQIIRLRHRLHELKP